MQVNELLDTPACNIVKFKLKITLDLAISHTK